MTIKKIAIAYTLVCCFIVLYGIQQFNHNAVESVDMGKLNQRYMQIVEELKTVQESQNLTTLEQKYACKIYSEDQSDYEMKVRDSIKNEDILIDYTIEEPNDQKVSGKIAFTDKRDVWNKAKSSMGVQYISLCVVIMLAGYILMGVIYYSYIRPFHKLKKFADNVARGDLDTPLTINQNNYFGAFTESFDLMREQLKEARQNEYQANIRKKELVAELSHDMKTPLATIKATCEVLKAKMNYAQFKDKDTENIDTENIDNVNKDTETASKNNANIVNANEIQDYEQKVDIIAHKVETIDQLIGNMFHATLEELEILKVESQLTESLKIRNMIDDFNSFGNVHIMNDLPECLVYMDELRLKQVIDNVINNSYKYAQTDIEVRFNEQNDGLVVEIRDFGSGVSDEELPAVSEKFYRGMNAKGKDGSGLGLYLSKYFMEHMNGGFECFNDHGFVVELYLKKA